MSLSISVKINGDKTIARKLRNLGEAINDMTKANQEIGEKAAEYYKNEGFSDRGRPWGNPWAALSKSSATVKQKKYPGRPTLVATGDMQAGFYAKAGRSQVVIGNHVPYYKYHQSSGFRKSKLPRRQMAGINNPIKTIVKDAVRGEIVRKLRMAS